MMSSSKSKNIYADNKSMNTNVFQTYIDKEYADIDKKIANVKTSHKKNIPKTITNDTSDDDKNDIDMNDGGDKQRIKSKVSANKIEEKKKIKSSINKLKKQMKKKPRKFKWKFIPKKINEKKEVKSAPVKKVFPFRIKSKKKRKQKSKTTKNKKLKPTVGVKIPEVDLKGESKEIKDQISNVMINDFCSLINASDFADNQPKFEPIKALKNVEKNVNSKLDMNVKLSDKNSDYGKLIKTDHMKSKQFFGEAYDPMNLKALEELSKYFMSKQNPNFKIDENITTNYSTLITDDNFKKNVVQRNTIQSIITSAMKIIADDNKNGYANKFHNNMLYLSTRYIDSQLVEADPTNPFEQPCLNAGMVYKLDNGYKIDPSKNYCVAYWDSEYKFTLKSMTYPNDIKKIRKGEMPERRPCCYCMTHCVNKEVHMKKSNNNEESPVVNQPFSVRVGCVGGYKEEAIISQSQSQFFGLCQPFPIHRKSDYMIVMNKKTALHNKNLKLSGMVENKKKHFHQ